MILVLITSISLSLIHQNFQMRAIRCFFNLLIRYVLALYNYAITQWSQEVLRTGRERKVAHYYLQPTLRGLRWHVYHCLYPWTIVVIFLSQLGRNLKFLLPTQSVRYCDWIPVDKCIENSGLCIIYAINIYLWWVCPRQEDCELFLQNLHQHMHRQSCIPSVHSRHELRATDSQHSVQNCLIKSLRRWQLSLVSTIVLILLKFSGKSVKNLIFFYL